MKGWLKICLVVFFVFALAPGVRADGYPSPDALPEVIFDEVLLPMTSGLNGILSTVCSGNVNSENTFVPSLVPVTTGVSLDPPGAPLCAPVPEPGTMLLLGFGLIGLAGLNRKRTSNGRG